MLVRLKNLGLLTYAMLCFPYWFWLLRPHAIPHGFWANEMLTILIIGGLIFGLGGLLLTRKIFTDPDLEASTIGALYGIAAFISSLLWYGFRDFPGTLGGWFGFVIMLLSLASALYLLGRAAVPRMLRI